MVILWFSDYLVFVAKTLVCPGSCLSSLEQSLRTYSSLYNYRGFPGGARGKEPSCQGRWHKRCGFYLLILGLKVKVTQLCPTLCDPMDCTAHGILQARMLGWVVVLFSRGSSSSRNWTQVSHIAGGFFTSWATREAYPGLKSSILSTKWNIIQNI